MIKVSILQSSNFDTCRNLIRISEGTFGNSIPFTSIFFLPSMFALLRHVLEDCVAVEACRVREGIRTFLSECRRAGWSRATSYRFYITGMDEGGVKIPRIDHLLRGASLVRLTDMWLSTWT